MRQIDSHFHLKEPKTFFAFNIYEANFNSFNKEVDQNTEMFL